MPWKVLLTPEERRRGVTYAGSGASLRAFAAKLLSGQPVRVAAVGGSITAGHGAQLEAAAYPWLFFAFMNGTFPPQQGWAGRASSLLICDGPQRLGEEQPLQLPWLSPCCPLLPAPARAGSTRWTTRGCPPRAPALLRPACTSTSPR